MHSGANDSIIESPPLATLSQLDPIHVGTHLDLEKVLARLLLEEFDPEDWQKVEVRVRLPNGAD